MKSALIYGVMIAGMVSHDMFKYNHRFNHSSGIPVPKDYGKRKKKSKIKRSKRKS